MTTMRKPHPGFGFLILILVKAVLIRNGGTGSMAKSIDKVTKAQEPAVQTPPPVDGDPDLMPKPSSGKHLLENHLQHTATSRPPPEKSGADAVEPTGHTLARNSHSMSTLGESEISHLSRCTGASGEVSEAGDLIKHLERVRSRLVGPRTSMNGYPDSGLTI